MQSRLKPYIEKLERLDPSLQRELGQLSFIPQEQIFPQKTAREIEGWLSNALGDRR